MDLQMMRILGNFVTLLKRWNMTIHFSYFNDGEIGNDTYHVTSETELNAKTQELRTAIELNFDGRKDLDVIDEEGFFGIMDRKTGDYAKLTITR